MDDWQSRSLAEVCIMVTDGSHFSPKTTSSGYPYITVRDIKNDQIDFDGCAFVDEFSFQALRKNGCSPKFNDVLFSKDGTVGKVALVDADCEFVVLSSLAIIRPDPAKVDPQYLSFLLRSPAFLDAAIGQKTGVAIRRIILKNLKRISIPYPSIVEQRRIVGVLNEAFAAIDIAKANIQQNLQNVRALFESHLQSVFARRGDGWEEKCIGDIAQVKGGKRVPKGYKLLSEATDHPYLRVTEFADTGTIDTSDLRYISDAIHREIKRYVIYSEDLYISIAGTIGKTGIIPKELDGANLTENACRLVFNPGINNRFVYYFTLTPNFIAQAGLNTRTAAQPKLALSRLATIKLGIPTLVEQVRLAAEFDAIRKETQRLESIYQSKLAALDALKQSLLHLAFSGQL